MQLWRDAANGSEIGGDIVAGGAVAARCAASEDAFLITEINGEAVHFGLDDPIEFFVRQDALNAIYKFAQFLLRIGVVEAQHRFEMLDRFESLKRLAADALRWRIGRDEIGKLFFQIEKLTIETVIVLVGDGRLGEDIVGMVVLADFVDQLSVARFGFVERHGILD